LPFYIGKGQGSRCYNHLTYTKTTSKRLKDKINSLRKKNLKPLIEIVEENLTENKAYEIEEKLIKQFGRKGLDKDGILMNICLSNKPPVYNSTKLIEYYYSLDHSVTLTNELVLEVETYLANINSFKKYNNLLKTDLGKNFICGTKNFPMHYSIQQRLYHIHHNLTKEPTCEYCDGKVSFKCYLGENDKKEAYQYANFCSTSCRNKSSFGRRINQTRTITKEERQKRSQKRKEEYASGKRYNHFKHNNPMLTTAGKNKWKESRNA
jgi:hypothetical protein